MKLAPVPPLPGLTINEIAMAICRAAPQDSAAQVALQISLKFSFAVPESYYVEVEYDGIMIDVISSHFYPFFHMLTTLVCQAWNMGLKEIRTYQDWKNARTLAKYRYKHDRRIVTAITRLQQAVNTLMVIALQFHSLTIIQHLNFRMSLNAHW